MESSLMKLSIIICLCAIVGCDFTTIEQRPWTEAEAKQRALEHAEYAKQQRALPESERIKQDIAIENLDLYFEVTDK